MVVISGSFGAGNYAMCGRTYSPNFIFFWPTARISVMGGPQAAGVLTQVERATKKKKEIQRKKSSRLKLLRRMIERAGHIRPYQGFGMMEIDPVDTRRILSLCISASLNRGPEATKYGVFRM